jgi:hypothetical protein
MTEEHKQKPVEYRFIKSTQQGDQFVGIMADENVLGKSGVDAMRSAARMGQFNSISIRAGVHFMDAEKLQIAHDVCRGHGMQDSVSNLARAITVVNEKNGIGSPSAKPKTLANAQR